MHSKRASGSDVDAPTAGVAFAESTGWQRLLDFIAREADSPERAYRELRDRLVRLFVCRGSHPAEDLADETLSRVALKLAQGDVQAERPAAYVLGVARMIDLEWRRREGRFAAWSDSDGSTDPRTADDGKERLLAALERCLQTLPDSDRRLLLRYHEPRGEQRNAVRQGIADELAIGLNLLRVRVHRLRQRIDACVQQRLRLASVPA